MKRAPLRHMFFTTLGEVGFPLVTTTPADHIVNFTDFFRTAWVMRYIGIFHLF